MANPNYYYYGFLIMISYVVLLIAPIGAGDDTIAGSLLGGKKLIIGLPYKSGNTQFVDIGQLNSTNNDQVVKVRGYSIDVFVATIAYLERSHYNISFEYRAFVDEHGKRAGNYDALVYQIFEGKYDAVVGDVTILENRSNYADFTLPYTKSNVNMLVKIRHDPRLNMWIFVRPFSWSLWLAIAIISTFIGGIILFMERNVKKDSTLGNSSFRKQFSGISVLWLPVMQAVFPERESLAKNCSRFVLVMWLILVFVLSQSYTACLSTILTVHQLQPQYLSETDVIEDLNISVGYNTGSFVEDLLVKNLMIDRSRVKNYLSIEEYKEALDKGSHKGGVDAIFDEAPYLKLFLNHYGSNNYAVVGTRHHAGGFGFAFRKGSTLTPYFSKAILNISESNEMDNIEETYFGGNNEYGENQDISKSSSIDASPSLTAFSFAGLFMVIGILSLLALLISESYIWRKPVMLAKTCSQFLSRSSTKISPLEEGSATRDVDKDCSADTQNIGPQNVADNNKTLPV